MMKYITNLLKSCLPLGFTLLLFPAFSFAHNAYNQTDLVSDLAGVATHTDSQLVNPWGIAFFPGNPIWVADNNSGVSTLYQPDGSKLGLVVTLPPPASPPSASANPTGIVANASSSNFSVGGSPSIFLFDGEEGTISGWNGNGTMALVGIDNSAQHAVYKGLTLIHNSQGDFLLATNFRSGKVEVYDQKFKLVHLGDADTDDSFRDPNLPSGYAPFGVHLIDNHVFVTYAKQNPAKHDPVIGPGRGFVSEFTAEGHFIRRVASRGVLDAPWGVVKAPTSGFGAFSGKLLIGNFGDGIINAFDPEIGEDEPGKLLGQLENPDGTVIHNPGLWDMVFGADSAHPNTLFFTAGILSEAHGLFGTIEVAP